MKLSLLLLPFFLALSICHECTEHQWTNSYHFSEWHTDALQSISKSQGISLTVRFKEMFDGFTATVALTATAATPEQAKSFQLVTNATDGVPVQAMISETMTSAASSLSGSPLTLMAASSLAAVAWNQDRIPKVLLAAVPAGLWVGGAFAAEECTPVLEMTIYLSLADYSETVVAVQNGTLVVDADSVIFETAAAEPDEFACGEAQVANLFPSTCAGVPVRETLTTGAAVAVEALLLTNVFKYYDAENAPHQKCALEVLQKAIENKAYFITFTCMFRNQPTSASPCGSKILLTNVASVYNPTASPHQKTAVEYLQANAEKEAAAWQSFVSNWRKTTYCVNWEILNSGNCGPKYSNAGCNPNTNYCCSSGGWCGNTDDHCNGGIDYRTFLEPKRTNNTGGAVTLTGKECSGNHPTTSRKGACIDVSQCTSVGGIAASGLCPSDPTNIKCCDNTNFVIKRPVILTGNKCSGNHPLTQRPGVCTASCPTGSGGQTVSGLCPNDPANVLCCDGKGFELQFNSNSGLCADYAGKETFNLAGNGGTVYTVTKILSAHLVDPSAYNAAPTARDNTMEVSTACAFSKMRNAALQAGVNIKIASGFRTLARQQYFWNCYQTKACNGGNLAAYPGSSNHGIGKALDLNTDCGGQSGSRPSCGGSRVYQWLYANAQSHGFVRTVQSEPWHWEYRPGTARAWYS